MGCSGYFIIDDLRRLKYSVDVPFMMVTSSSAESLEPVCCQSLVALFVHIRDTGAMFHSPFRRAQRIFPCSLLKGEFQNLKSCKSGFLDYKSSNLSAMDCKHFHRSKVFLCLYLKLRYLSVFSTIQNS